MQLSQIDRNRILVAGIFTALVLPITWIASASSSESSQTSAPIEVTTTTLDSGLLTDANDNTPANLEGPQTQEQVGQGQIAYPSQQPSNSYRGNASFKLLPNGAETGCATNAVPLGTRITVQNLNNGRKVTCTNINIGYIPPGVDIVLHTRLFGNLANLVDAPLPVELTW